MFPASGGPWLPLVSFLAPLLCDTIVAVIRDSISLKSIIFLVHLVWLIIPKIPIPSSDKTEEIIEKVAEALLLQFYHMAIKLDSVEKCLHVEKVSIISFDRKETNFPSKIPTFEKWIKIIFVKIIYFLCSHIVYGFIMHEYFTLIFTFVNKNYYLIINARLSTI